MWHLKCFAFWCCIRIFSSSKSLLQYQHHGFSCFFFLRPITAHYRLGRIEAKRSWGEKRKTKKKKERRDSHSSRNQPPPPRPAGNRHKMADTLVLSPPPVSHRGESWSASRDACFSPEWVKRRCRHLMGLSGGEAPWLSTLII